MPNTATTIRELGLVDKLTDKQRQKMWELIDDWYNNTDVWDLLEMSGVIDTPVSELN